MKKADFKIDPLEMNALCSRFEKAVFENLSPCLAGKAAVRLGLAALSGGADSSAMLAALAARLAAGQTAGFETDKEISLNLHAHHINHGIRPAENCIIDQKAAFDLCKKLGIPFTVTEIAPGTIEAYARHYNTGIEGAARHFRYKALSEEARRLGADFILTAHTADDRLETILMAFLRGAGPAGLGALAGSGEMSGPALLDGTAPLGGTSLPVLRPLLTLSRREVLEYLKQRNISYCTDETNEDEHFFRNRVRLKLIPLLDESFPHWRKTVLRLGDTQFKTAAFIREEAKKSLVWTDTVSHSSAKNRILTMPGEDFFSRPEILREEILYEAINALTEKDQEGKKPRRDTLRSFIKSMDSNAKKSSFDIFQFRLDYTDGQITVKKKETQCTSGFSVLIKCHGVYKLKELTMNVTAMAKETGDTGFYGLFPLVFRSIAGGTILAEDRRGRAAVLKNGCIVWKRRSAPDSGESCFSVQ